MKKVMFLFVSMFLTILSGRRVFVSGGICDSSQRRFITAMLFLTVLFLNGSGPSVVEGADPDSKIQKNTIGTNQKINAKLKKLSVPFIVNNGQITKEVAYYAQTLGGTMFVTVKGELVYSLPGVEKRDSAGKERKLLPTRKPKEITGGVALKEELIGATIKGMKGESETRAKVSYFSSNDQSKWKSGIATYEMLSLGAIYDDIELKLRAHGSNIEKLFYVKPGADAGKIKVKVEGAKALKVNNSGELEAETELGIVKFTKPAAYQEKEYGASGKRQREYVEVVYEVKGNEYGFKIGEHDKNRDLVIDPLLSSTFLGGGSLDEGRAVAIDSSGDVYVTGITQSPDYPATTGAYKASSPGGDAVFVSKLDSNLEALLASTFLGPGQVNAISIDSNGSVYITGITQSKDYPTTVGAFQTSIKGGSDVFISKLDGNLSTLLGSTFLGGSGNEGDVSGSYHSYRGVAMIIDSAGTVCITGTTSSADYPATMGAYNTLYSGYTDVFVSKLSSNLSVLLASTYLGFGGWNNGNAIVVDTFGNIYVTGSTTPPCPTDSPSVFIVKLSNDLSAAPAVRILGGYDFEQGLAIAIGATGNVYVAGYTMSSNFPTTTGAYKNSCYSVGSEVFVTKWDSDLNGLLSSTCVGGDRTIPDRLSMVLDASDHVYIAGTVEATDYPTTDGAYQTTYDSKEHAFVSKLDRDLSFLLASTFLGGNDYELGNAIALDVSGNAYVIGFTTSADFPISGSAYDTSLNGYVDAYVSKLDPNLSSSGCDYVLTPASINFMAAGGTGSAGVTASAEACPWTVKSNASWITVTSGSSGNGSGTVSYAISANMGTTPRSGAIAIGGQVFAVTQEGIRQFTLTLSKSGTGTGTVTSADGSISCGTECSAAYNEGTVVTLAATPSNGYIFSGWSGGACSGTGTCSFAVNADTTVTATFAPLPCIYSIDSTSAVFSSAAGTDSVKVTTQSQCKWTASNTLSWITIKSGSSGTGSGTVSYSVAANSSTSQRTGSMTIAGNTFTVTQSGASGGPSGYTFCSNENQHCSFSGKDQVAFGANGKFVYKSFRNGVDCKTSVFGKDPIPGVAKACYTKDTGCTYTISPASKMFGSNSSNAALAVTTSSRTCKWTATSNASWMTITSGSSGSGSKAVGYSVSANTGTSPRTGTLTVAGQTFTVTQAGASQYTLSVSGAGTGGGTVTSTDNKINCGSTCSAAYIAGATVALTAVSNNGATFIGWSGAGCSGTGNCSITLTADTNVTATFASCTFSIAPAANQFGASSGTGNVAVSASSSSCTWTAASNALWITITSGGSGTGNGNLRYTVSANTGASSRTGTLTIAGQTFTITQDGIPQYTLTVSKTGTGSGLITSADGSINCGTTCSAVYNGGSSITLTAASDNGYIFTGWSGGGCSGTGTCTVSVNVSTTITAAFTSPIQLTIISPGDGSTINENHTTVIGTVSNSLGRETGVIVNGIAATIYGNQFVVNNIPLTEGTNTITVSGTDTEGSKSSASVTVNAVTTGQYISVSANPEAGISPLEVTLKIDGSFSIKQSTLLYEGPPGIEVLSNAADEYRVRLNTEGVYYFVVRSSGTDGNTYEDSVAVTVLNKTQMDSLLKAKWAGMKGQLQLGDTEGALSYMAGSSKNTYKYNFDLMKDYLPAILQDMGNITMKTIEGRRAEYEMITTQDEVIKSFYIEFIVDSDGIWRINFF